MDQNLPSDNLAKPTRRAPWIVSGVLALGVVVSAVAFGPAVAAQFTPAPSATATVAAADAVPTLSSEELDAVQQAAVEQQKVIAAEKAAADAAAAQAAADAAAKASSAHSSSQSGPIKCPAGSSANSGDGQNDTSCLPDICFHLVLPDPAHPECETPFKP